MMAVTSIETDIMQVATATVDRSTAVFQGSGLTRPELVRSAAAGNITTRLAVIQADEDADPAELRINTTVQNRILNAVGIWSVISDTATTTGGQDDDEDDDEDDEMLLDNM